MRPIICKIIHNHDWDKTHVGGSQYVYECKICKTIKRVNIINGKERKVKY